MAGPGGTEVGRVSVKVVPDVDGFRDKVKKELEEVEKMSADVTVELDLTKFKAQIEEIKLLLKSIGDETVNVNVNKNGGVGGLAADTKKAAAEAKKLAQNMKEALGDGEEHRVSRISRAIEGLAGLLQKTGSAVVDLGSKGLSQLGDGFKSVGGSIAGMIAQLVIWIPLIAGLIGAVTFLVGFLAAGLLTLPAILFGILGPLAAVVLGFEGIKKAAQTLKPELDALKKRLSDTFAKELKPLFESIKKIFPTISNGLNSIATGVSKFVTELSKVFTSAEGVERLAKAFQNVNVFLDSMLPGIKSFLDTLLQAAAVPEIFQELGGAISDVFKQFQGFIQSSLDDKTLVKSVQNFRLILNDLVDLFTDLLTNSLKFFNGAAPGMDKFFRSLSEFFGRIDWEKLGKAFGDIFGGLADAISQIPPETIQSITDSFVSLGEAVGKLVTGKSFDIIIAAFQAFIDIVTLVILIIDGLLEGFASIGDGLAAVGEWFANLDLIEEGKRIFQGLWDGIVEKWDGLVLFIKSIPGKIDEFFGGAPSWLIEHGKEILQGLWDGIVEKVADVFKFFRDLPGKIVDSIPSPSEILKGVGKKIMDGLLAGIQSMIPSLGGILGGIGSFIISHKGPPSKDKVMLVKNGQLIMEGLIRGLQEGFAPVSGLLDTMSSEIGSAFSDPSMLRAMQFSGAEIATVGNTQLSIAGQVESNSLENQIVKALEGWTMDGKGLARTVNNMNTAQRRRG